MSDLLKILQANRDGEHKGIYSICSAHPLVLEAAFCQALTDDSLILIESTANQVNQFGGYTGMQPRDFPKFVADIARPLGVEAHKVILGGDHLGPVCWQDESAEDAMAKAEDLVAAYAKAGFKKIHLDASMSCADDPQVLSDETVASRAARLCKVAEEAAIEAFGESDLIYVIGTEVPKPGGATDVAEMDRITDVPSVRATVSAHQTALMAQGIEHVWPRVVGLVVEPGLEFSHNAVCDFVPDACNELSAIVPSLPGLIYEAHSTDFQTPQTFSALIKGHFAILKVGPQLTFALREGLFALSFIEDEVIPESRRSNLRKVCDDCMTDDPSHWRLHYPGQEADVATWRRYAYSDRIRYYWNQEPILRATNKLVANLTDCSLPLPLLSQFLPKQYAAVREGLLQPQPLELVKHHIMQVTATYAKACNHG